MTEPAPPILVVDDDEDIREMVGLILQSSGYRVVGARDGLEAWQRVTGGGAIA